MVNGPDSALTEEYVAKARELVQCIEDGDEAGARRLIDEITQFRENTLFQELGKLTREFHNSLNAFRLDERIANVTETDFPDARERLKHVVKLTAESADRTLTAVEQASPICDEITSVTAQLRDQWQRFTRREMDANEFRRLSVQLQEFFDQVDGNAGIIRNNLNEVLMAQDFQDLTGQIISRVITLVDELEHNLVDLIRISGQNLIDKKKTEKSEEEIAAERLEAVGPAVPGLDEGTVSGQDEVDDLLSSLGF